MTQHEHLDAAEASLGNVIDASDVFGWRRKLMLNDAKRPRANLANVATALRHAPEWKGVLGYDEFARQTVMCSRPPWVEDRQDWQPRPWTDSDDIRATEWMQREGIHIKDREASLAVQIVAGEHGFHPVRDYLDGLHWDGEPRLEVLLPAIFGADPTAYVQAVFRYFPIGSVARIYEPGVKMDVMLVLEGRQGVRKSTAVRELYGEPFTAEDLPDITSKDAAITVGSAWCIEVAELSAMVGRRKELEAIKAFITRRVDNFRPPYGRRNIKAPRHSVLVGTTNAAEWMRDETGARRFWPVRCGEINIDLLRKHRDQLWAEAVALYRLGPDDGGAWWFTDRAVIEEAREQQEARYAPDPWEPLVLKFIAAKAQTTGEQILMDCLMVSKPDLKTAELMRIASILRRAGWSKRKGKTPAGKRGWLWCSPDSPADEE